MNLLCGQWSKTGTGGVLCALCHSPSSRYTTNDSYAPWSLQGLPARSGYRGFSHTWPNPRDCWGGSILGVKLCNSCSGSGRYDIETTCATLVKESRNVQTKYRSSGSNYPYAVLVILFYIINMHGLTRIGPIQSLLGYTEIVNLSSTLSSTEVIWLTWPWTHLKGIIDVTCCWMGSWCTCKRGIIMAK